MLTALPRLAAAPTANDIATPAAARPQARAARSKAPNPPHPAAAAALSTTSNTQICDVSAAHLRPNPAAGRTFMMRTMAASICGLRSSSTFSRVSAFSLSFSRCRVRRWG